MLCKLLKFTNHFRNQKWQQYPSKRECLNCGTAIQKNTTLHTKELLIDTDKNMDDLKSQIQECMPIMLHTYETPKTSKEQILTYTIIKSRWVFTWDWEVSWLAGDNLTLLLVMNCIHYRELGDFCFPESILWIFWIQTERVKNEQ